MRLVNWVGSFALRFTEYNADDLVGLKGADIIKRRVEF
jgi:hypothetical protein